MTRKKIGVQAVAAPAKGGLAEKLADELRADRAFGQPIVIEQEYITGKVRVTVIWDAWADDSLEDRSSVILRAYELAEGTTVRDKIALASGLTVPEAAALGMLPFQVIAARREGDPITPEKVREALLEEGASELVSPKQLHLRFATGEEAEACRDRLTKRFPGTADVWLVNKDLTGSDGTGEL